MLQLPKHSILLRTLAGLGAVVLCISIIALATPGSGALSNFVFSAAVLGGKVQLERNDRASQWEVALHTTGETDVITQVVTLAPGGFTGWHTHPGPQILSVNAGTGTLYHGDDPTCTGEVIAAGHSHIDDGSEVRNFRNEGTTNVVVYNTYLAPHGAAQRIDAPAPGNCPF
jgi:mannose-6-phosphate isomerase-like protein (cupin superfamily)